jgi:DNA-binding CsgD family transcriptional regulator
MEKDKRFEISEANVSDYLESYLRKNNIKKGDLKLRENKDKQIMIVKKIADSSSLSSRRIADVTGINREVVRTNLLPKEPIS